MVILVLLIILTFTIIVFMKLSVMKLSELNGRLIILNRKADTILARLGIPADPDVPVDAEAGLNTLEGKLDTIISRLPAS